MGGDITEQVLESMALEGRVAVCGMISQYDQAMGKDAGRLRSWDAILFRCGARLSACSSEALRCSTLLRALPARQQYLVCMRACVRAFHTVCVREREKERKRESERERESE